MTAPPKRVLIVDDHDGVASALCVALRADGRMTPIGPSASVAEGIRLLQTADAVVLDLNLTDSEGVATLTAFRAEAPHAPIIVYSAADDATDLAAADASVPKGDLRGLLDALDSVLGLEARPR